MVPTVQMVFRRSLQNVRSREDYLSAAPRIRRPSRDSRSTPPAWSASPTRSSPTPSRRGSNSSVTAEELGTEGRDFFGQGLSEQLFDTPSAIARVWRSRAAAAGRCRSRPPPPPTRTAGALSLRVAPAAGRPRAGAGSSPPTDGASARITLDWQEPFRISEDNPLTTSRVDIGVFANNGVHDSAPAIISWYFPPEEARSYAAGPDGALRIASIDYAARPAAYADPMLIARADWRDDYH